MRRHPDTTFMQLPAQLCSETERLQSEIKELKERLNNTERLLQKESSQNMEVNTDFTLCNTVQYNCMYEIKLKYSSSSKLLTNF